MGGMITAVDPQAKTISIHQETIYHDRVLKLEVSQKVDKELSGIKTGDLVNVWVKGKVVTALNKVA
jgi:Cu/Ag efflux protein CusF